MKIAYVLLFLAGVAGLAYYYIPLIKRSRAFEQELEAKKLALQQEEQTHERLKREIDLLKTDPEYVEKVARDKLGYGRDGETLYRFESLEEKKQKEKEALKKQNPDDKNK